MLKGIDINQRIEFSSKSDDSEPKTIFIFKPMSAEDMLNFAGDGDNGQLKLSGSKIFSFLEMSIVEIKNYEPVGTVASILRTLPPMVITELVQESASINKITGQDQKN